MGPFLQGYKIDTNFHLKAQLTDAEEFTNKIFAALIKVTGESSIEMFATNNEVVYISSRVHVPNKLTRTKYSY